MSIADEIFACDDLPEELLPIPEWNKTLLIKGLSAADYDEHEASLFEVRKGGPRLTLGNVRARLAVKCALDPETKARVFTDHQAERLGQKASSALARIYEVAQRLCGATKADQEELEKNLKSIHGEDSISA